VPDVTPASEGGTVKPASGTPAGLWSSYGDSGSVMLLARTKSQVRGLCGDLAAAGVIYRSQSKMGGWNDSPTRLNLYNALQRLDGVGHGAGINPNTGQSGLDNYGDGTTGSTSLPPASVTFTADEAAEIVSYTPATYFATQKNSLEAKVGDGSLSGDELAKYTEPEFWVEMTNGAGSVENMLAYDGKDTLRAALERNDGPIDSIGRLDCPDVLTIHASKGKEADTVGLYDGIPPKVTDSVMTDEMASEAESRVWYVAATRAAENLFIFRDEFDWTKRYLPGV